MDKIMERLITLNRALSDLIVQYKEHIDLEEQIEAEGPVEYQPALEMTRSLSDAIIADVPETLGLVNTRLAGLAGFPEQEGPEIAEEVEEALEEEEESAIEREWSLQIDPFAFTDVWVDVENVRDKVIVDVNLERGYHQVSMPFELTFDKLESLYQAAQGWHGEKTEEKKEGYLPLEEKMPEIDHVTYELDPYSPSEEDMDYFSGEEGDEGEDFSEA